MSGKRTPRTAAPIPTENCCLQFGKDTSNFQVESHEGKVRVTYGVKNNDSDPTSEPDAQGMFFLSPFMENVCNSCRTEQEIALY